MLVPDTVQVGPTVQRPGDFLWRRCLLCHRELGAESQDDNDTDQDRQYRRVHVTPSPSGVSIRRPPADEQQSSADTQHKNDATIYTSMGV